MAQLFEEVVLPFLQHHKEITKVMIKSSLASTAASATSAAAASGSGSGRGGSGSGSKGKEGKPKQGKGKKRGRGQKEDEGEEEGGLTEEQVKEALWPVRKGGMGAGHDTGLTTTAAC